MEIESDFKRQVKALNYDKMRTIQRVRAAARAMSTPDILRRFPDMLRVHGRAVVALAVAATIDARRNELFRDITEWADMILELWTVRPPHLWDFVIHDGLHPSKIGIYAELFINSTIV